MTYFEMWAKGRDVWDIPRFEPVKRNHDGFRYHGHRFPIKGGITITQVIAERMGETNEILRSMRFVE